MIDFCVDGTTPGVLAGLIGFQVLLIVIEEFFVNAKSSKPLMPERCLIYFSKTTETGNFAILYIFK